MVFPVVTYGCESWIVKKAEHQRIDAFKPWCWRWLQRVPFTARRSGQSVLKEINPEYSLEGLMLKLKHQYFFHLIWTAGSLEKHPDPGKDWGQKEKGASENAMSEWHNQDNGPELEHTLGDGEGQRSLVCYSPCGRKELDKTRWLNHNNILLYASRCSTKKL